MMDRRAFTQSFAAAFLNATALKHTSGPILGGGEMTREAAPQDTSFKLSVMLWTVFTDLPFEQRLEKVAEAGYQNVELVGEYDQWREEDFERVNAKRKELGINFDCTAGLKHGVGNPDGTPALLAELSQTLPIMHQIDCPSMILLSGNRVPGMPRQVQHQCCIDTLKTAAKLVEGKSINR